MRLVEPLWRLRVDRALAQPGVAEAAHLVDDWKQVAPLRRQLVLDTRRRLRVTPSLDDLLALERPQTLGERPRRDPRAGRLELREPACTFRQVVDDQRRPFR